MIQQHPAPTQLARHNHELRRSGAAGGAGRLNWDVVPLAMKIMDESVVVTACILRPLILGPGWGHFLVRPELRNRSDQINATTHLESSTLASLDNLTIKADGTALYGSDRPFRRLVKWF